MIFTFRFRSLHILFYYIILYIILYYIVYYIIYYIILYIIYYIIYYIILYIILYYIVYYIIYYIILYIILYYILYYIIYYIISYHIILYYIIYMVGGFNPSEKYESQLGSSFPICGKKKLMFQTTNQICIDNYHWYPRHITAGLLRRFFLCLPLQRTLQRRLAWLGHGFLDGAHGAVILWR